MVKPKKLFQEGLDKLANKISATQGYNQLIISSQSNFRYILKKNEKFQKKQKNKKFTLKIGKIYPLFEKMKKVENFQFISILKLKIKKKMIFRKNDFRPDPPI